MEVPNPQRHKWQWKVMWMICKRWDIAGDLAIKRAASTFW